MSGLFVLFVFWFVCLFPLLIGARLSGCKNANFKDHGPHIRHASGINVLPVPNV